MTVLFAHHLEAHHVPVLVGLFAAGFFIGWQALSWLTAAPDVAAERWWVLAARRPAPDVAIPRVGLSPAALVAVSASSKARCLVPRAADAFRGALVRSC